MAPLPVIANVSRVALNWTSAGLPVATNVMHFFWDSGTPEELAVAIDGVVDANDDHLFGTVAGATVSSLDITPLDGETATLNWPTISTNWIGSASGEPIPQVCALVKLGTPVRGRTARGRVYLPNTGEGATSEGNIAGATVSAGQDSWDQFIADLNTASCPLLVASYVEEGARPVTSVLFEARTATQRRRQKRT